MKDLPLPRKRPQQARSGQMVELILEATARLLAEKGYAATTTNLVADRAGVSVGSVYQYFPNKASLVASLHERHASQTLNAIERAVNAPYAQSLEDHIQAVVRALLAEHETAPALHKVLEREFSFFDAPRDQCAADCQIHGQIRGLLDAHRDEIASRDLELSAWAFMTIAEAMVHAAIIDPPARFSADELEKMICSVIVGFLKYSPNEVSREFRPDYEGSGRTQESTATFS
ncbi:TetR/AcrR family transcriptional regulator [Trinickia fusca]|uniref:TetR/AcrR family transcriptional regulator n=1 Tax=Trinickia fusca TaxID=2419777 RepID=A0A494X8B7_9BURK|nr:TetR/AcrR family transcriptional regulator [Trinickia fusca]RKP46798.1 TetR/AcrR family transcriptional regulator [Trinickia fusca]